MNKHSLDAVVIADNGQVSLSASNPLRLQLDGHTATIQVVRNFLGHAGNIVPPVEGDGFNSWDSAPKLNGIYLYNALSNAGFSVDLINDFQRERNRFAVLALQSPKAVIISTTFVVSRDTLLSLVREVKRYCPETVVVVGGPFVAFSWRVWQRKGDYPYDKDELKKDFLFFNATGDETDLYIISDTGEDLLIKALHHLRRNRFIDDLPNTARLVNGSYHFSKRVDDLSSWQDVPIDWATLPDTVFTSGVVPMRASTGCPNNCSFCNFNKNRLLTRVKPLDILITEMKAVQARGAKYVWFADDNFRLGKRDLVMVCKRFIDEGLTLKWMTLLRADVLKNIDLELLHKAGCIEVQMGIESADSSLLAAMNKQADPTLYEEIVTRLLKTGINCTCYFIVGFPGETEVSVNRTIAFIKRLETIDGKGLLSWSLYPFVLVPGSPIFEADQRAVYKIEGYKHNWQHKTMDSATAQQWLIKAFMSLENSGPIYRGDNLEQLNAMPLTQLKEFIATRHTLEKQAAGKNLDKAIALEYFKKVFAREGISN